MHDDIDFALGGDMADLHSVIHSLRGDGPVAQVRYFGEPALLFTTYESVDAAYRDDDLFPAAAAFAEMTEPSMGRTLQCMGGDEHKRNRKLVSPAFRARIMPDYVRPILEEVAHELIDEFVAAGEADLVARRSTVVSPASSSRAYSASPTTTTSIFSTARIGCSAIPTTRSARSKPEPSSPTCWARS